MKELNISGKYPRLYFDADDIARVKNQLQHNSRMQEWFLKMEHSAADLLKTDFFPEEYANSVYDQHGRFWEITAQLKKMSHILGFLFQLTGKPEYAGKLRDAMLHYSSFRAWAGPLNKDRKTPWKSELNTAEITEYFAYAWDCIFYTLDENEKKTISCAMIRNGIVPLMEDWVLPGTRIHALDSMGHNWWAVCIGLAGVGICSIYEYIAESDSRLEQICSALNGFVNYSGELLLNKTANFDDGGLFYEGPRYSNYGVGEMAHFYFVYSRCFGNAVNYNAALMARAFVTMVYPTSETDKPYRFINFGDTDFRDLMLQFPLYFVLLDEKNEINNRIDGRDLFLLKEIYTSSRLSAENPVGLDFVYYSMLWDQKPADLSGLPLSAVHEKGGVAVLRSSWDKDALLFAVRCGHTWNHAHDDGGSFVLYNRGRYLLTDTGTCQYGSPMYRGFFTNAIGHNVVTANGIGQFSENNYRGTKYPGTLSHYMENDWCVYLLADATGPLCDRYQRNYRSFIRLYGDCFLILDDIRTYQPAVFEWLLHYEGELKFLEGGSEFIINNSNAELKIATIFPRVTMAEKRDLYPAADHPDKKYYPYLALSDAAGQPNRESVFLHLISLDTSIKAEPIESDECIGVKFIRGNIETEMYYNLRSDGRNMHVNSNNLLGGYDTDAYIMVKTTSKGKSQFLLVYGSYLRKDGISLYENFAKKFTFL